MQHCAACHVCAAHKVLLCAEGTEWWKKAPQKQAESKHRAPLFNEFVDEEVGPVVSLSYASLEQAQHLNMHPPALHTDDCMAHVCAAIEARSQGMR